VNESSLRAAVTLLERRGMSRSDAWVKVRAEGLGLMGVFAKRRRRKVADARAFKKDYDEFVALGLCTDCEAKPAGDYTRCPACRRRRAKEQAEYRRKRKQEAA
jgi:hypothetical protein